MPLRDSKKSFSQVRPDGHGGYLAGLGKGENEARRVLYRLPQLLDADTVYVVEGEKDVHTLEALGYIATTNSGGANGKWTPEMYEALHGKRVILLPDQDPPGQKRGAEIAAALADSFGSGELKAASAKYSPGICMTVSMRCN